MSFQLNITEHGSSGRMKSDAEEGKVLNVDNMRLVLSLAFP
jgi:hypothetical protein